jgi:Uma2 family endonuclease
MARQLESKAGISSRRHFVTLEEYDRMVEAGVFEPDSYIELIRGEIVDLPPPGPEHEASVARLHRLFNLLAGEKVLIWPQGNSIGLPQSNSRPQPDITLLRWRDDYYAVQRPLPDDVLLLVEVSDSTLKFDRNNKLQLYASAGIKDYWVVNLVDNVVEVYSDTKSGKYGLARTLRRGEMVELPGGLGSEIAVNDILGNTPER